MNKLATVIAVVGAGGQNDAVCVATADASNWIAGVETDIQASSGQSATNAVSATNVSTPFSIGGISTSVLLHTDSIDWFGNVRGGPGYAIWPGMMVRLGRAFNKNGASRA
jgi:hypothetical protein